MVKPYDTDEVIQKQHDIPLLWDNEQPNVWNSSGPIQILDLNKSSNITM